MTEPHIQQIDDQWNRLQPNWDREHKRREREVLYDLLEDDESIVQIVDGRFDLGLDPIQDVLWGALSGIVVATDRRVIVIHKGLLGAPNVAELPYTSMEEVEQRTGMFAGSVFIKGSVTVDFLIGDINKREAKPFADYLRSRIEEDQD